jgi:ASC-1-like (ASCH) protein
VTCTESVVRAHEMGIYKRYFDLIATGRKSTEIRVNDSSRRKIKEGSLIRFRCEDDQVLTRVARYETFDEMVDHEDVASVNPLATRDEQLADIRQIHPPNAKLSLSAADSALPHHSPGYCGRFQGSAKLGAA